jgi:hypothetical protein
MAVGEVLDRTNFVSHLLLSGVAWRQKVFKLTVRHCFITVRVNPSQNCRQLFVRGEVTLFS